MLSVLTALSYKENSIYIVYVYALGNDNDPGIGEAGKTYI